MKKIAILGAVLALSTSAIADDNSFYIKAGAFGSIGHKLFDDSKIDKALPGLKAEDNKYGEFTFGGTVGAGYQLMDNVRVELQGSYFAGPKWKYEFADVAAGVTPVVDAYPKKNLEVEASGFAVLLSPAVDLIDMGPAKLYVTGGAGISYVKVKAKVTKDAYKNAGADVAAESKESEWESKVRFAWSVGAGVAFEVSPGVSIDVGYSFTDLGKPAKEDFKEIEIAGVKIKNIEFEGNNLRSHNVNVGVRFSL
jgi:hypothetical protein